MNGDDITHRDVVVWCAGHFMHDVGGDVHGHDAAPHDAAPHGHVVGPELRPHGW